MARIETYAFDTAITPNDYVIGTDGDSLNATKNYRVLTFLDYLGRTYNLNSTDLLFNYSKVPSTMVSNGGVSTNNYADGTVLMSGVTNIYVSKLTAFGQLVDDILTLLGTENLSIMFTDTGNRNNLGIFEVTSAVDVNANTINLAVTSTTAVGSIDDKKVMGIRIGVGGGGTIPNLSQVLTEGNNAGNLNIEDVEDIFVKKQVIQSSTNANFFGMYMDSANTLHVAPNDGTTSDYRFNFDGSLNNNRDVVVKAHLSDYVKFTTIATETNAINFGTTTESNIGVGGNQGNGILFDNNGDLTLYKDKAIGGVSDNNVTIKSNNTFGRDYTLPDKDGTFAMLSDVPVISNLAYDESAWNGNNDGASKNAIRDVIESQLTILSISSNNKKSIPNGTGLGSRGGVSSTSLPNTDKPVNYRLVFEGQGADLADLYFEIEAGGSSSTPPIYTPPAMTTSTATQTIIIEVQWYFTGTECFVHGTISNATEVIPFFKEFTGVVGTRQSVILFNPTASGGTVRFEYWTYWQ